MDAGEKAIRAASFGAVAATYDEFRPGYPAAAVEWMVGTSPGTLLELGAGTGKLTKSLATIGHQVVATDPSADMLRRLAGAAPTAVRVIGRAEAIPLPSSSVDAVVAAQAFHWFDHDRALPEIVRVLRPGGVLALVWNSADQKVPWVKKVFGLVGLGDADVGKDPVEDSELFAPSERLVVRHWQEIDRDSLIGFCASQSHVLAQSDADRRAVLDQVGAIYDSYGRAADGMQLPWNTYCYRARVSGLSAPMHSYPEHHAPDEDDPDDGLLVEFR
ncbi:MAG TPA: class I SAM-dependent methyltransferase [Nocardioidaceae bacterium]|jgi:SAM-dependent methyltransferase